MGPRGGRLQWSWGLVAARTHAIVVHVLLLLLLLMLLRSISQTTKGRAE